jgi:hypothetical protein
MKRLEGLPLFFSVINTFISLFSPSVESNSRRSLLFWPGDLRQEVIMRANSGG